MEFGIDVLIHEQRDTLVRLHCAVSLVAIYQTSKPHEIAKRLNAQYRAIEKSSEEMGRDLVLLKQTKPLGIEWGIYLKELGIEFSREYADRLI